LKRLGLYFLLPVLVILLTHCAKIGSLTGGPKDTKPPVMIHAEPPNYSIHFKGQKIEITFDEFIVLDNVNQQLVVSPPVENRVDVRLKTKTILIDLNNELQDSTTYTLNFGDAIKDNNEGNLLNNFEYVFSTGDYLDSLAVYGRLVNAFDLLPSEDPVSILLYDDLSDSAFMKHGPLYVSKTGKEGYFALNNLKSDTFHIFALKDVNSNYTFDLPNEAIAFLDTSLYLTPAFFSRIIPDTVTTDTLTSVAGDSLLQEKIDSSEVLTKEKYADKILVDLYLFTEDNARQYLTDFNRQQPNLLEFMFNKPVTDSFRILPIDPSSSSWYVEEDNPTRDTFKLWVADTSVISMDTVLLRLEYMVKDTLGNSVSTLDTLSFGYRKPEKSKKKKEEKPDTTLIVHTIKDKATIDLNRPVFFSGENPYGNIDTTRISLFSRKDTVFIPEGYYLKRDTLNIRRVALYKTWKPETTYRIDVLPGAFTDIYGLTNDTLDVTFTSRSEGYYGTLHVDVKGVQCPLIVQLMDMKQKLIRETTITEDNIVSFNFLKPSRYMIKFIHDCNGNGKWDTGDYMKKIQPERVEYYNGEINVRSNWELEINQSVGGDRSF